MPTSTSSSSSSKSRPSSASRARTGTGRSAKSVAATVSDAGSITNYTTALRWLYEHVDHERQRMVKYDEPTFNLDRMSRLLSLLGDPQDQLKAVHVAGTKGKGSTCAMICSMLEACGYTVGSYSSPHLIDLRERITINQHMIPYADCADMFRRIAEVEPKFRRASSSRFSKS